MLIRHSVRRSALVTIVAMLLVVAVPAASWALIGGAGSRSGNYCTSGFLGLFKTCSTITVDTDGQLSYLKKTNKDLHLLSYTVIDAGKTRTVANDIPTNMWSGYGMLVGAKADALCFDIKDDSAGRICIANVA